jgi:hypothetical protein
MNVGNSARHAQANSNTFYSLFAFFLFSFRFSFVHRLQSRQFHMKACLLSKCGISAVLFCLLAAAPFQSKAAETTAADRDLCEKNLHTLYKAIQSYRSDHKELPAWLSDLIPKYIKDPNVLVCPVIKKTGSVNTLGIEDPKISTAYLYEFADTPIPGSIHGGHQRTMKEWKRRQMGVVGSKIPMVRCFHHQPNVLNLTFDGRVYEGPGGWEGELREVRPEDLAPDRLFAVDNVASLHARSQAEIPPRDSRAPARLIDLSKHYNAALTEGWHRTGPNDPVANDLSTLPRGLQKIAGVDFDLRGVIQLVGRKLNHPRFPAAARNIKVDQKASRLHFLHATGWTAPDGTPVATFVIHLANGQSHEFTIEYGQHITDWVAFRPNPKERDSIVAWSGTSPATGGQDTLNLFKTEWVNPDPDQPITRIDYISANNDPAPFLIAITAE